MRARRLALAVLAAVVAPPAAHAQSRLTLNGTVTDSATGAPLDAVRVTFTTRGRSAFGETATNGRFQVAGLQGGWYTVTFQRIGYRPLRLDSIHVALDHAPLRVSLVAVGVPLDAIVVSAARTAQARLDAPASVTVVSRADIAAHPALTAVAHVADAPGVDAAKKGILQETYTVRGDASANSGALLTLTDYRYADVPSLAINIPYLIPATDDDIERIELERGPGSALYGPNSSRGVLLILTRSPFDSPGGSVSITGGTRSLFQGSARYAFTAGRRVGFKLSGQYVRAHDWPYTDSTEQAFRDTAIAQGANPTTLLIGKRDSVLERGAAEARMDVRLGGHTTAIATAGVSQAFDIVDQTSAVGGVQGRDWRYTYLQGRLRSGRFFANAVYNASDAGQTYVLQTGNRLVDNSRVLALEVQDGARLGPTDVVFGADGRWTDPRTGGTIDGRNENNDRVTEIGAYASTTTSLGPRIDVVAALRGDHHSVLDDLVASPRAGIIFKPAPTHAIRLMYNRAFTSPDANSLFIDIAAGALPYGLPYTIRAIAVPQTGFSFERTPACGGLCMRSPFVPGSYLPVDATVTWPAVVALVKQLSDVDLSVIPPPTATEVGTAIKTFDVGSKTFVPFDTSNVTNLPAPRRAILNTGELGYQGVIGGRVRLDVDAYVNHLDGVSGPRTAITPTVYYDQTTLERYLAAYLPAQDAERLAGLISQAPAGTISPVEARDSTDILIVSRQGGGYTVWGADVTVQAEMNDRFGIDASYSWVSDDDVPNVRDVGYVALNVPRNKAHLALNYRDTTRGLTARLAARLVQSFPVTSGVYVGRVPGYGVLDATVGLRMPFQRNTRVQLMAYNLTDNRHQEFVGAPFIGRLLLLQLHTDF